MSPSISPSESTPLACVSVLLTISFRWTQFANAIFQNVSMANTSTRFHAGAFAGESTMPKGVSKANGNRQQDRRTPLKAFLLNRSLVGAYWTPQRGSSSTCELVFVGVQARVSRMCCRFSEHHYSGTFCSGSEGVLADLMNKATIRGNLSQYIPDIQATKAQGFDYILGETNSYSCHVSIHIAFGVVANYLNRARRVPQA